MFFVVQFISALILQARLNWNSLVFPETVTWKCYINFNTFLLIGIIFNTEGILPYLWIQ